MASKRAVKAPCWTSNWTVHGLLDKLPGYRRVDRGGELLAFRVAGDSPTRTVYIYLYGDDPSAIHFDLEDSTPARSGYDQPPEHGSVWSAGDLALVVRWWLAAPLAAA
jgi:hypothetical protein